MPSNITLMTPSAGRLPAPWQPRRRGSAAPAPLSSSTYSNAMPKNETILALDPGLRELGFVVLSGKKLITCGVSPLFLTQDRVWKIRYFQNLFDALALAVYHQMKDKQPSRSRSSG